MMEPYKDITGLNRNKSNAAKTAGRHRDRSLSYQKITKSQKNIASLNNERHFVEQFDGKPG
jgi:hypothetical protein